MLASFFSPSFAWHAHATHHEIADMSRPAHGHDHPGHAHEDGTGTIDAHTSIGHLVDHLTMQIAIVRVLNPVADGEAPLFGLPALSPVSASAPPYRPPARSRPA
jgi:hypothetical protein